MQEIVGIIIKWAIPFFCALGFTYVSKQLKDNKKHDHAIQDSMVILLRSQIVSKAEKYIAQGYLPDYARSCLEDLFKQYSALGGNHGVGKLVDKCFELPPINKGGE